MKKRKTPGEIITFYSYKGGTGRSMALSNIACLLADQHKQQKADGKGVLMIDWDLEAPGLHRFFYNQFQLKAGRGKTSASTLASTLDKKPGLIDLFRKLDEDTPADGYDDEDEAESQAAALLDKINFSRYIVKTSIPSLDLLKAGCFDEQYSTRVNTFNWEELYKRSPYLIRRFAERLAEDYKYVLIDSRTGHTDISGICTMLMPQKLVVVFTPNRQSLTGVLELIRRATKYRRQSDDLRPLLVFPLPSRIEATREDLRTHWRFGNSKRDINGYQPLFTNLFKEVYELDKCNLEHYFDEVQIQQSPNYAYGEEIAVRVESQHDRFSLTTSFKTFAQWLAGASAPWDRRRPTSAYQYDIFISYAAQDQPWAVKLFDSLQKRNIQTFLDKQRIGVGYKWGSELATALKSSQHLVVIWSKHAASSDSVRREASYFEASSDPVFAEAPPLPGQDERRLIFLVLEAGPQHVSSGAQVINDLNNGKAYQAGVHAIPSVKWESLVDKIEKAIDEHPLLNSGPSSSSPPLNRKIKGRTPSKKRARK